MILTDERTIRVKDSSLNILKTLFWHEPAMLVYFLNKLYDHNNPDGVRRPWNDLIIPESINGRTNDPKVGKPWDLLTFPHK